MKTSRLVLVPLVLAGIAALAAGCGGGGSGSVPSDAVATVAGTPITKSTFDALMNVAFARFEAQGQKAPKIGTPAYTQVRDQAIQILVGEQEFLQEGQKLGVTVTQKDVNARLAQTKQIYFHNSEKQFQAALKKDHITLATYVHYNLRPEILSEKLKAKVTSAIKVSKSDAQKYYNQNKATFTTPPTREVRHILVNSRSLAERILTKLKNGASFAKLAKQYSKDTTSAQNGGKLCVAHGGNSGACQQTVPPFDKAAFSLQTHEISQPVHSQFGWHIIQALTAVKPSHTQSFAQVASQIESNLATQKQDLAWQNWLAKLQKDYKSKVSYQSGYAPATVTTPTIPTTT